MRCTLLTAALLVPQGAAFAPTTSARGTAKKLHAAPYERYLDAACEAARAAGALIRSASTDERAVDTLKANAKDLLTKTDVACQDVAAAVLARREPASRLLGEEDVAPGGDAARRAAEQAFATGRAGLGRGPHRRHGELRRTPSRSRRRRSRPSNAFLEIAASSRARSTIHIETSCLGRRMVKAPGSRLQASGRRSPSPPPR